MGIGCGKLTAVHVGGIFKRWEYILSGPPMTQVGVVVVDDDDDDVVVVVVML